MSEPLVSGEIIFAEPPDLPPETIIRITLRDTSAADALSGVVAEQVLKDIATEANRQGKVEFALPGEIKDARGSYTISVHVDLNGNGQFKKGDFINMQSYPVLTYGQPNRITVQVKRIKL